MKPFLLVLLLGSFLLTRSQYKLYLKNDDTTELRFKLQGIADLDTKVAPGISGPFNLPILYPSLQYAIYSRRGNFVNDGSGSLLPAGQYILIFMWNQKTRLYRTILRQKTQND